MSNCAIILAGGEGKRMKSNKPKTLSEVLGKPMLWWVMSALKKAGIDDICVVKGFRKECIEEYLSTLDFEVESVFQAERLGTGHAVMMAKDFLKAHDGNVVILNGDAPFMTAETIEKSLEQHISSGAAATVISARVDDPAGYGRIVRDDSGSLKAIVEHKDADEATRAIDEVNSGGYWFDCQLLLSVLDRIRSGGFDITEADLIHEGATINTVGRMHMVKAFVKKGYAKTEAEAFEKYIDDDGEFFVKKFSLTPEDSIELIHRSGGIAIFAHPAQAADTEEELFELSNRLKAAGIDGMECLYSRYTPAETEMCFKIARELDILPSGGSDFHGENKPDVRLGVVSGGDGYIPYEYLERLKGKRS